MIKVNDTIINVQHFSDGSQKLVGIHIPKYVRSDKFTPLYEITWKYENEAELVTLIYIVNYIRDNNVTAPNYITLKMLWVPNARMDRIESEDDVFTLKYFAQIINSLKFNKVIVLDPHSRVTNALIDRIRVIPAEHFIQKAIKEITTSFTFEVDFKQNYLVCFPDNGAFERYSGLKCFDGFTKVFGKKHRDWKTGKITKLDLNVDEETVKGKNVFIVDDMISSGETLYQFIQKLKSLGVLQIYVYCSHLENRIMLEENNNLRTLLDSGAIRCIFTTDSLFNQTHPKIHILDSNGF